MTRKILFAVLLVILFGFRYGSDLFIGDLCILKSEFIFHSGDVPFPSSHASSLTETNDGLLERIVCFGIFRCEHILFIKGTIKNQSNQNDTLECATLFPLQTIY